MQTVLDAIEQQKRKSRTPLEVHADITKQRAILAQTRRKAQDELDILQELYNELTEAEACAQLY